MGITIWEMIIVGLIAYFIYYKFIKKKPAEAEEKVEIETEARAETGIYFEDDGLREKVVNEIKSGYRSAGIMKTTSQLCTGTTTKLQKDR